MKIEYKCRFCNKIIKRKRNLKKHEEHCWLNSKNKDILKCEFCGKNFKKPGALGIHKRVCLKNTYRKPLENQVCNWTGRNKKEGGWICPECNEHFETKNDMYNHRHKLHNLKTRDTSKICELCGEKYDNKRKHIKICSKRRHAENFKWTEEEKKQIGQRQSDWLKNNLDKHYWKTNQPSKPCEHLKTLLRNKNITFDEEYTDSNWKHSYSLDIAFVSKKIAIEVNGNQHYKEGQYFQGGELKEYYQNRHDYLISEGWTIYEIHYLKCYDENFILTIIHIF